MPVAEGVGSGGTGEVFFEFTAVVGEYRLDAVGEHGSGERQEVLRGGAGVALGGTFNAS